MAVALQVCIEQHHYLFDSSQLAHGSSSSSEVEKQNHLQQQRSGTLSQQTLSQISDSELESTPSVNVDGQQQSDSEQGVVQCSPGFPPQEEPGTIATVEQQASTSVVVSLQCDSVTSRNSDNYEYWHEPSTSKQ